MLRVLRWGVLGFDGQGGDTPHGGRRPEFDGHGGRLGTGQVTHLADRGGGVVEVGAELAHPLGERQKEHDQKWKH